MKKSVIKIIGLLLILTLLVSACKPSEEPNDTRVDSSAKTIGTEDENKNNSNNELYDQATLAEFDAFCEELALDSLASSPLNASFMYGNLEALGLEHLRSELDDFNVDDIKAQLVTLSGDYEALKAFDYNRLTKDRQITYDMIEFSMEIALDQEPYLYYSHNIQPSSGIQVYLPISLIQIEFDTEQEVIDYLSRISKVANLYDQVIEYLYVQTEKDFLLPAEAYLTVIEQIDGMVTTPETFMMYLSFVDRVDALGFDEAKSADYKAQCLGIITDSIFPAYDRLKVALEDVSTYATTNTGISTWENGAAYYEYLLYSKTSYKMTIEEYRSLLMDQISKFSVRIQALATKNPDLMSMDFEAALPTIANLEEVYATVNTAIEDQFLDYGIENASEYVIPEYLEDYLAGGFYFPVTIDGEDYGNMYLPASQYDSPDAATLELYFHENIPGHHLYFAHLYQSDLPLIRKVLSWLPYEEGWATYVQGKAYEYMGFDDDLAKFFYYAGAINQYSFALMDLQLHVDGATYEDMVTYLTSMGYPEDGAVDTVNRMIGNPGESIHYTYGYYKMHEYRLKTMEALGEEFDFASFHDLLLSNGSVPFRTMDAIVDDYIAEKVQ